MSYIPDCRAEYETSFLSGNTGEPNPYYEGNLSKEDALEIQGYDWCTEEVVDNFFNNLDTYFDDDSVLMDVLNKELPEYEQTEYEFEWTFGDRGEEKREVRTYGDLLRSNLLDWIESERNELIVSMIEGYPEEGEDESD